MGLGKVLWFFFGLYGTAKIKIFLSVFAKILWKSLPEVAVFCLEVVCPFFSVAFGHKTKKNSKFLCVNHA